MGRDGTGWDGMGRDGTGWDGMGRDGTGWDGMGGDGTGREGMGRDGMGRDGMGRTRQDETRNPDFQTRNPDFQDFLPLDNNYTLCFLNLIKIYYTLAKIVCSYYEVYGMSYEHMHIHSHICSIIRILFYRAASWSYTKDRRLTRFTTTLGWVAAK